MGKNENLVDKVRSDTKWINRLRNRIIISSTIAAVAYVLACTRPTPTQSTAAKPSTKAEYGTLNILPNLVHQFDISAPHDFDVTIEASSVLDASGYPVQSATFTFPQYSDKISVQVRGTPSVSVGSRLDGLMQVYKPVYSNECSQTLNGVTDVRNCTITLKQVIPFYDQSLRKAVYFPARLITKNDFVMAAGPVLDIIDDESDRDIWVKIGQRDGKYNNGSLVVEFVCQGQGNPNFWAWKTRPDGIGIEDACMGFKGKNVNIKRGDYLIAFGPLVLDLLKNWLEIHPSDLIDTLTNVIHDRMTFFGLDKYLFGFDFQRNVLTFYNKG